MGSYFKGWVSTLPFIQGGLTHTNIQDLFMGHVLDVYYDNEKFGKIRVRIIGDTKEVFDDDIEIEAFPADLSFMKMPLPGEIVAMVQCIHTDIMYGEMTVSYYYFQTITSNQNITFNSDPYIGQTVPVKLADKVFVDTYETRFEDKITSLMSYKNTVSDEFKIKKQLQPFEGDFILQGRSGAAMRFGSSGYPIDTNPWSNTGEAGSPIITITANGVDELPGESSTIVEDINKDNSSVYVSVEQIVPVNMASTQLKTHAVKYNLTGEEKRINDEAAFLQSTFQQFTGTYVDANGNPGGEGSGGGEGDGTTNPSNFAGANVQSSTRKNVTTLTATGNNANLYTALDAVTPATSPYLFGKDISTMRTADGKKAEIPKSSAHGGRPGVDDNWESNNAWDIHVPIQTPVYSVTDGTVWSARFSYSPNYVWGWQVVTGTSGRRAFYTHMDHTVVTKGSAIKRGDLIGFIGWFPNHKVNAHFHHLHIGLWWGDKYPGDKIKSPGPWSATIGDFVDLQTGKIK